VLSTSQYFIMADGPWGWRVGRPGEATHSVLARLVGWHVRWSCQSIHELLAHERGVLLLYGACSCGERQAARGRLSLLRAGGTWWQEVAYAEGGVWCGERGDGVFLAEDRDAAIAGACRIAVQLQLRFRRPRIQ
jgi:hypothetical protein